MSTESLNCPNCGAPLALAAGASTVTCDHCGSVVAARATAAPGLSSPPANRRPQRQPPDRPARGDARPASLSSADAAHIVQLLRANREQKAVRFYQARMGGTLDEAVAAVRAIAAMPASQGDAAPAEARAGNLPTMPKPPRPQPAKTSVQAWPSQVDPGWQPASRRRWVWAAIPLGLVALFVAAVAGCSASVQGNVYYHCALNQATAAINNGENLSPPIHTSPWMIFTSLGIGKSNDGQDYINASLYMPVWGSKGFGLLYLWLEGRPTFNEAGANLIMPGRVVNLLPFKWFGSNGWIGDYTYTCP